MNRGEIWWFEHPSSDPRPACILTRQTAVPVVNRVLVAFATTQIRDIPTEVPLGKPEGMPADCVLSLENIRSVRKAHLTTRITRLGPAKLAELCAALHVATDCR